MIGNKRNTKAEQLQLGDVTALAAEVRKLRDFDQQYDRGIAALIAARRIVNGWDEPKPPDMPLTARREILELTGTSDELAAFDAEHRAALVAEQEAAAKAQRAAAAAPVRAEALERHLRDLAKRMTAEVDPGVIEAECERLFAPSAQRMLEAAKAFLNAWRDMKAIAAALRDATAVHEADVYGDGATTHRFEPIGRAQAGDWLPTRIAGISSTELQTLNTLFTGGHSSTVYELVRSMLKEAGVDGPALRLYRPGVEPAERQRHGLGHRVYAEDPNPPMRRPETVASLRPAHSAVVAGTKVEGLPSAPPATVIGVTTLSRG